MSSRLVSMKAIALAVAGSLGALTAGCTAVDPGMGEALKYDMIAQTVNPDPQYNATALAAGYSGAKAQKASERYRKDAVKPIERESTSSGRSGASSGSGPK